MLKWKCGAAIAATTLVLASGCSEKNITEVVQFTGAIYGQVQSDETGVTVEAWQAKKVGATVADNDGYFTIADLPPGTYVVKVTSPSGAGLEIPNVSVDISRSTDVGTVSLLYPAPLMGLTPADGATSVSPVSSIGISSSAPLDLTALDEAVTISPALDGTWQMTSGYAPYTYTFKPDVQMGTQTTYVVTIGTGLTTQDGRPLDHAVSFSFSTDAMKLTSADWRIYSGSPNELMPGFTGDLMAIGFNAVVDPASVDAAISIDPPVAFVTNTSTSYGGSQITVTITEGLHSGTDYHLAISSGLKDMLGGSLQEQKSIGFATQSFQLTGASYPNGQTAIPPRLATYNKTLVSLTFNDDVDAQSVAAALSISPEVALHVALDGLYDNRVSVQAPDGLSAGTAYSLAIHGTLSAWDGAVIGTDKVIQLQTQPLEVTEFYVGNDLYGGDDTMVDPGSAFVAYVTFNADVDVDAFNEAAVFSPAIAGFWYLHEDYSGPRVEFFTTEPPDLMPGAIYTLTIDGSVPLSSDATLGDNVVESFAVRPVMVISITPSPGARNQYPYTHAEITFDTPMDHSSTEAAITFSGSDRAAIDATYMWLDGDRRVRITPATSLTPGETYFVSVTTTALSQLGPPLAEDAMSFFQVGD